MQIRISAHVSPEKVGVYAPRTRPGKRRDPRILSPSNCTWDSYQVMAWNAGSPFARAVTDLKALLLFSTRSFPLSLLLGCLLLSLLLGCLLLSLLLSLLLGCLLLGLLLGCLLLGLLLGCLLLGLLLCSLALGLLLRSLTLGLLLCGLLLRLLLGGLLLRLLLRYLFLRRLFTGDPFLLRSFLLGHEPTPIGGSAPQP